MEITDLLDEYGISYKRAGEHHHARDGWVQISPCPWCGSENFHLGYNLARGTFVCYRCSAHPTAETLAALFSITPAKARTLLPGAQRQKPQDAFTARPGPLAMPMGLGPLRGQHRAYLESRGLDPDVIAPLWGLQGFGPVAAAGLAWRVFLPIHYRGRAVGWTARAISQNNDLRYKAAPEKDWLIPRSRLLYGLDFCSSVVVVVEGPLDAIALGPGAVATLGVAWSMAQAAILARFPVRAICFDADAAGQRRASQLLGLLAGLPGKTTNVVLESAKDPGAASETERRQLRRVFGL